MSDWKAWDANNPPPPGTYVVWHSRFRRPGEQVWTFRVRDSLLPYTKIKGNKLRPIWFNAGNWEADAPPEYYCPLPRFQGTQDAAPQPGESA